MYCIPKDKIKKLRKVFSGLGDNQIAKLADMKPKKRIKVFKKQLSEEEAFLLNRSFEQSVSSKKIRALGDWVKKNLDEKYRDNAMKKDIVYAHKNFKTLDEVDTYIESRVDMLAEQSEGLGLTTKELGKFTKLGDKFFKATKDIKQNLGKAEKLKENIVWGKAYKELAEYSDELMPKSKFRGVVQKYGRASMLASLKTPFLNVESNTINAITEAVTRRAKAGSLTSSVSGKVEMDYIKFANKMFKETGVDFTRMISLEDTITGINKVVGEESQNIGIGWMDNASDFVFNKMLTTPDVAFSSIAFTDSLALNATRMAKGNKKTADKLFKEATQVGARGDAGVLREVAINDARLATYTNESWSSKMTAKLRETLNYVPGLGDWTMPFIKTPANVAELGADYAGLGLVKGGIAFGKHFFRGKKLNRTATREAMADMARSGVGMSIAFTLASTVKVEDFNGAYDTRKIKVDQIGNLGYNAVKIKTPWGSRWISTDYLGPIGVPFVAMMYAKKYGGATGYVSGATAQYLSQLPFVDGGGMFDYLKDLTKPTGGSFKRATKDLGKEIANGLSARMIPGISYDIARATDAVQRDTYQKKFVVDTPMGKMNFDKFIQKIPYLRKGLPEKTDALGRIMYESTPLESMFFGARVRTARTDEITSEILRLREVGQLPSIKDLRFMRSTKVDELKARTGDDFYDVARKYGEDMAVAFGKEMRRGKYQGLSDEEKKDRLYKIGQDLYAKTLRRNRIKYR